MTEQEEFVAMYVTLSEGPRADMAAPILATGDQRIVHAVLAALSKIARETSSAPDAPAPPTGNSVPHRTRRANVHRLSREVSGNEED
jgi:hypothetical protein